MRLRHLVICLSISLLSCSTTSPPDASIDPAPGEVAVSGRIVTFQDATPVDGGVTMTVETDPGRLVTAYMMSFFRLPQPEEWEFKLYEIVRDLKPGDEVFFTGIPTDSGIRITRLHHK